MSFPSDDLVASELAFAISFAIAAVVKMKKREVEKDWLSLCDRTQGSHAVVVVDLGYCTVLLGFPQKYTLSGYDNSQSKRTSRKFFLREQLRRGAYS